jgi:hypothetical protein
METSGRTMKKLVVLLIIFLIAVSPAFSQKIIEDLQNTANDLIDSLAEALPFNSTIGLNWSDAYIGQFPFHFGIGVSAGFTTMDFSSISNLLDSFGVDMESSILDIGFPLPAYTVEARLGGIIIPLDIGFKFGYLKPDFTQSLVDKYVSGVDFGIDYLLIGADFRYALFDKKVFPFKLSIGLGINYLKGGINTSFSSGIEFNDPNYNITISQESPELDVYWNTINFELKPQISFPFKFLTPYTGVGLSFSLTEAGYKVTTRELTLDGGPLSKEQIMEILKDEFGLNISTDGFRYAKKTPKFNMRAFGGFSVNLVFVRLDLTGMYNFTGGNFGATLGFRFQL